MSNTTILVVSVLAVLGICGLAMFKGAAPERWAGGWVLATFLTVSLGAYPLGADNLPLLVLSADGVLAIALLFISIQFSSLWLGAAMLLQSSAFALHAWFLTTEPLSRDFYLRSINLLSYAILLLVLCATLTRWIQRVLRRRASHTRPASSAARLASA